MNLAILILAIVSFIAPKRIGENCFMVLIVLIVVRVLWSMFD